MKKILVPTDFSDEAEYALNVAAQLARKFNSRIYLLHMIDLPIHLATSAAGELPEAIFFMKLAHQKFEAFMSKPYLDGIRVEEAVETDLTHNGIDRVAHEKEIDLIVMGSSGASGVKEILIGSNTEKVVRTSQVPVLIIKNETKPFVINDFVYACNFHPDAFGAYRKAINFAEGFNAKVHLLYVNTPHAFSTTQDSEKDIEAYLKMMRPENYTVNIYNDETVENGILNFSRKLDADVIGMSTHGRKGLAHFFNGSISEDLANHAIRPVITFRI